MRLSGSKVIWWVAPESGYQLGPWTVTRVANTLLIDKFNYSSIPEITPNWESNMCKQLSATTLSQTWHVSVEEWSSLP